MSTWYRISRFRKDTTEVSFPIRRRDHDPWGYERAAFTAKTSIDRRDFGLTRNEVS
jgi:polyisoprenoid-binding protein YceI